jgi:hypothetical protein
MFDDNITDVDIENFISKLKYPIWGRFQKWMRKISGVIQSNWHYEVAQGNNLKNQLFANSDLEFFKQITIK